LQKPREKAGCPAFFSFLTLSNAQGHEQMTICLINFFSGGLTRQGKLLAQR
jgi:hypothetical protein